MIKSKQINILGQNFKLENFTTLPKQDLLEILKWRNTDLVRLNMNTTGVIVEKDHLNFVNGLKKREDKCFFKVSAEQAEGIGVIYLDNIDNTEAWLGIYANPFSKRKMRGTHLMNCLFELAFRTIGLKSLWLEVKQENKKARTLYKKFNFYTVENRSGNIIMKYDYGTKV